MERLEFKREILEAGKQKQQSIINDFRSEINRIREDTESEEGAPGLNEDGEMKERGSLHINLIANQLNFAVTEMDLLNRMIVDQLHEEIGTGSVVITDQGTFFISVSLEDFKADGQVIFGISTQAPLYEAMKGLRNGDCFAFNQTDYIIKDVF